MPGADGSVACLVRWTSPGEALIALTLDFWSGEVTQQAVIKHKASSGRWWFTANQLDYLFTLSNEERKVPIQKQQLLDSNQELKPRWSPRVKFTPFEVSKDSPSSQQCQLFRPALSALMNPHCNTQTRCKATSPFPGSLPDADTRLWSQAGAGAGTRPSHPFSYKPSGISGEKRPAPLCKPGHGQRVKSDDPAEAMEWGKQKWCCPKLSLLWESLIMLVKPHQPHRYRGNQLQSQTAKMWLTLPRNPPITARFSFNVTIILPFPQRQMKDAYTQCFRRLNASCFCGRTWKTKLWEVCTWFSLNTSLSLVPLPQFLFPESLRGRS